MKKQTETTEATRTHILNAFWELYKEMPFEKISVNAVAAKANIHRSTFYRYFTDIQNVLEELENDLIETINTDGLYNLSNIMGSLNKTLSDGLLEKGDELVSALLMQYSEKIYYLTSARGDMHFKDKLYNCLRKQTEEVVQIPRDTMEFDYLSTLIFTIILTNSNYCYEHRNECNPKEISALSRIAVKSCVDKLNSLQ